MDQIAKWPDAHIRRARHLGLERRADALDSCRDIAADADEKARAAPLRPELRAGQVVVVGDRRLRCRVDIGQRARRAQEHAAQTDARAVVEFYAAQVGGGEEDRFAVVAHAHRRDPVEAAHEETGADEKHDREAGLHDEQRGPHSRAAVSAVASVAPKYGRHVAMPGEKRRSESGSEPCGKRDRGGEDDRARIAEKTVIRVGS